MYTLIIVDDEEYVRNGFKNTIKWDQLGFTVTGTAENGMKALELIKSCVPDAVLTDIRMPEMDGLELIRYIKMMYPRIKVVLLSAYDDFNYARQAIKYGASGYLLKPLEERELEETFTKLCRELESETKNLNHNNISFLNESRQYEEKLNESQLLIEKAKKYVNEHYDKRIALEEIASYLYITPAYFSVIFKKVTGQCFVDYITQVKVNKSKELLKRPCFKVKEIAPRVGYEDYTYFCKIFKKIEGITPLEYRSKLLHGE